MSGKEKVIEQLKRWGDIEQLLAEKNAQIKETSKAADDAGEDVSWIIPPTFDGLPKPSGVSDPTPTNAAKLENIHGQYARKLMRLYIERGEMLAFEEKIDSAVDALPPIERRVIRMKYKKRMSIKEIRAELSVLFFSQTRHIHASRWVGNYVD